MSNKLLRSRHIVPLLELLQHIWQFSVRSCLIFFLLIIAPPFQSFINTQLRELFFIVWISPQRLSRIQLRHRRFHLIWTFCVWFCYTGEWEFFGCLWPILQLRCWVKEKESFPMNLCWWLIAVGPDVAWDAQLVRFSCSTTLVVFIYGRLSPYYSFIHPIDTLAAGCLGRRTGVPEKRDLAQTVSAVHGQAVWPSERLVWQKRRTASAPNQSVGGPSHTLT